ncbi:unnamed protein product, partial [Anisakis simplex]|uniref:G_PROTEIN_RECEP_F1_2 domain-containing protein n=1 Tax=Anisakis simplex TaxID=6269 RepID=A0A0M3IZQ8_ANISI
MVLDDAWNRTVQTSGHAGILPVHIATLLLSVTNCLLNGFICVSFHCNRILFSKCRLHIFLAFALTNALSGFFTIPTSINLFVHNNLNCPRWTIILGSAFEIALDRMRKLLTMTIAIERLYAVYLPSQYYLMHHIDFARRCCLVSTLWGCFDAIFMIVEDDLFQIRMHCVTTSSSGPIFHTYFLISSITFGVLLLFLYVLFIVKLCVISETNANLHNHIQAYAVKSNYRQVFRVISISEILFCLVEFQCKFYFQANSLAAMIVLSVLLFSVVPCALYSYDLIVDKDLNLVTKEPHCSSNAKWRSFLIDWGVSEMLWNIVFMEAGPVITMGYHMYGCSSFFIYSWQHRDIRRAIIRTGRRSIRCDWSEPQSF